VSANEDILDKKVKVPAKIDNEALKQELEKLNEVDFNEARIIAYSLVKRTGIKKTPDLAEIAIAGNKEQAIAWLKENVGKEITIEQVFKPLDLVDVRGITKGKGTQGPVKRFGISLRQHKAEKGRRRPGSIGPWHPARVSFRIPMAGQTGYHNRVVYNLKVLALGKASEARDINPAGGWHKYGLIRTHYIMLVGSVQGPQKRQLLLTYALRPNKKQTKKNYELVELV